MSKFPCSGCGLCCTQVGLAVKNAKAMVNDGNTDTYVTEVARFPHNTKADGSCEFLQPDHKCAIYETRPDICNIERTWEKHHNNGGISKQDYYLSTAMLCNSMILEAGAGDNFFIEIKKDEQTSGAVTA